MAALRAACPHDQFRRRGRPADARQALRASGLRRAGDHRPLVSQCATVDGARRRDPERGAELRAARATGTATCSPSGSRTRWRSFEGERRDLAATAEWITAQGGVAYLAHPYWTGANPGTLELPDTVSGIEVFNAGCELELGRGLSTVHWDELLDAGRSCYAIASDDSHHPGFDSDLAWTWVRSEPTVAGVLDALRSGCFYSTSGPRITSVVAGEGSVEVQCDPCSSVRVVFGVSSGAAVNAGRLGYRYGGEILAATPDGSHHGRAARPARDRPLCASRGRGRPRRQSLDEPIVSRAAWREAARAELARAPFDLLVIGGGIIGAGIASEAARLGLRVALVDRSDFGGATSSASSKLIHGGLRYLRLGDVKLVREAHAERRALLRVVAPHLVRRIPFMFPVYRGGPYRPATIQAGLWTYSTLAGDKLGGLVKPERARRSVPALRLDGLRGCGVYQDSWTHDGRLCLANVTAAAEAGATVLNYAEVVGLRKVDGVVLGAELRDRLSGDSVSVEARAVVNATGPWLDELRRLEEPGVEPYGQLSKGVHVTLPLDEPWSSALTIPHDQIRVTFAYPWEGMLLLGTTDTPYEGDPAEVTATEDDIDTVLAEAGVALDASLLQRDRVLATYAGLRVLPRNDGSTVDARRETAILVGKGGMLTVAGGKLTTYRQIAYSALEHLAPTLGLDRLDRRPVPLPGATDAGNVAARLVRGWELEPAVAAHLAHFYGSRADRVVALAADRPDLLERLHPDAPDIGAQVVFAAREEWATGAADVLHRRTTLAARGLTGGDVASRVEELLGAAAPGELRSGAAL